jgi:nudix-type nucleoside diphosphatase (YffH/AdpP family)
MSLEGRVEILEREVLADDWATLTKYSVRYTRRDGTVQVLPREAYDRGDGCAILPYDPEHGTVLLGQQFRLVAYVNGYDDLLIETAAGKLDDLDPVSAIKAEAEQELGLVLADVEEVMQAYMSPGSVTEKLYFYVARYGAADRRAQIGGLEAEGEEIEVLEVPYQEALDWIATGRICDAKTIMLLQYAALHIFNAGDP